MPYVDYEYYKSLYSTAIPEEDFNRLSWDACKLVDNVTTGIDGVKKLRTAFPTDVDDAEAVKRCICKLIDTAYRFGQAEAAAREAQGYVQREDGTVVKKIVSSVTAGAESISYATSGTGETAFAKALADDSEKERMYQRIVEMYLTGVGDANGVNLLYMGEYPSWR